MPIRPLAAALAILLSGAAQAAPSFVNGLALDGAMLVLSGGGDANNGRVGFFSDIYYDTQRNEWWGLSDRGPGGGTLDYATRVQRFTLDIDAATGAIGNFQIAETVIFKSAGAPLNGIAPSPASNIGLAFDPEGLVINPKTGTFLVSDEYGPSVREFSRSAKALSSSTSPWLSVCLNSSYDPVTEPQIRSGASMDPASHKRSSKKSPTIGHPVVSDQ